METIAFFGSYLSQWIQKNGFRTSEQDLHFGPKNTVSRVKDKNERQDRVKRERTFYYEILFHFNPCTMKTIKNIKFIKGLPDYFEDESLFPPQQTHMVILGNIFQASNYSEVVDIFNSTNIIKMSGTQNPFYQGKQKSQKNTPLNRALYYTTPKKRRA